MATASPEPSAPDASITELLLQLGHGNPDIEARLLPHIYGELRRLAARYMRRESANHTLQPTALVHEAYARLLRKERPLPWQNRAHFFATASNIMRHILVDHARAKKAARRGGDYQQVTLNEALLPAISHRTLDVLVLHDALEHLATFDPRLGRIVELHFFGGLTFQEIAEVLDLSERTAKRDWSIARDWLKVELSKQP